MAEVNEKVYKPAWRSFYKTILTMVFVFVAAVALSFLNIGALSKEIIWGVVVVLLLIMYLYMVVGRMGSKLCVRPDEVAYDTGVFNTKSIEISYQNLRTVEVTQTFGQRVFNIGTLAIASSGTSGYEIKVENIPNPYDIRNEIQAYERKTPVKNSEAEQAN